MKESQIERAKKIYALATKGIDGEKDNAQRMLDKFLEKYSITLEEISEDVEKRRYFKVKSKDEMTLLMHTITIICGKDLYRTANKRELMSKLTDYEYIQVSEMYEFHRVNFSKELNRMKNQKSRKSRWT